MRRKHGWERDLEKSAPLFRKDLAPPSTRHDAKSGAGFFEQIMLRQKLEQQSIRFKQSPLAMAYPDLKKFMDQDGLSTVLRPAHVRTGIAQALPQSTGRNRERHSARCAGEFNLSECCVAERSQT